MQQASGCGSNASVVSPTALCRRLLVQWRDALRALAPEPPEEVVAAQLLQEADGVDAVDAGELLTPIRAHEVLEVARRERPGDLRRGGGGGGNEMVRLVGRSG